MHKLMSLAVASAAAFGVVAVARPSPAQTTLTMSSWVSPQHHLTSVVLQGWANEVEKATNGRVKLTMLPKHPSAPAGTFDAVKDGLVDVSYVTASYTPARHVMPLMPELPGSGDTALVNSVAYSRIHWKYFQPLGEYKGVKLLGVFTHGPGQMFTKKSVRNIGDVQGLKIRTGGGVAEAVANALGASAFVKPAPESFELLKSGVADGVFFPLESVVSFKLETVLEQATLFPGRDVQLGVRLLHERGQVERSSPKEDQEAIEKVSGEHIARMAGQAWDDADKRGMEGLQKSGVKIVNADAALVAEVRKRSAPIIEDWIKKANAKGVDCRQDPRRVSRRAEEGRRGPVTGARPRAEAARRRDPRRRRLRHSPRDDAAHGGRRRGSVRLQPAAARRVRADRADAGGPDLRRTAAGLVRRRARHDGLHRPPAAARAASWRSGARCRRSPPALMFLLAWLVWLKADRIWAYRDATDVLRIVYGPFVYFMAVMIGLAGLIHLYKAGTQR